MGSTVSGAAAYFYVLEEYKVSNELLTEDIDVRFPITHFVICYTIDESLE